MSITRTPSKQKDVTKENTMFKSILLTAASLVALSSAASASSWEDAIAKAKAYEAKTGSQGQWIRGRDSSTVFKAHNGASGFIFGNVFADDVVLPMIHNIRAVAEAANNIGKPIVVASNDWILPSNPFLCEIAKQLEMDCIEFTKLFYMYSQKDNNGNYVGDEAATVRLKELQAQIIVSADTLDINVKEDANTSAMKLAIEVLSADAEANALVIASLEAQITELEAAAVVDMDAIANLNAQLTASMNVVVSKEEIIAEANSKIAMLESVQAGLESEITDLKSDLVAAQNDFAALAIVRDGLVTELATVNTSNDALEAELAAVQAEINVKDTEISDLNDTLDAANTTISGLETTNGFYQLIIQSDGAKIANLKEANKALTDLVAESEETIEGLEADLVEANSSISTLTADLEEANTSVTSLTEANAELTTANASLTVDVATWKSNWQDLKTAQLAQDETIAIQVAKITQLSNENADHIQQKKNLVAAYNSFLVNQSNENAYNAGYAVGHADGYAEGVASVE